MIKNYRNRAEAPDTRTLAMHAIGGGGIVRLVAILVSSAASVALARALGPTEYGIYALVFAGLTVLALPVQVGLPPLVVRETSNNLTTGNLAGVRGLWSWSGKIIAIYSIAVAVVLLLAAFWAPGSVQNYALAMLIGAPLIALIAFCRLSGAALNGLRHVITSALPDQVLRPLALGGFVVLLWLGFGWRLDAVDALVVHSVAAVLATGLGFLLLRAARPDAMRQTTDRSFQPGYWRRAFAPLIAIAGMMVIMQHVDLLMLGLWHPAEEAGIYKIAVSGATLAIFGLRAITLALNPRFAGLHAQDDQAGLARFAALGALASVVIAVPVLAFFVFWGRDLIELVYGVAFGDAIWPLIILMISHACVAATGLGFALLAMTGRETVAMRRMVIGVAVNIALNTLLVPAYGVIGAALATGGSLLVLNVLYWRAVRSALGFDCSILSARLAVK